MTPPAEVDKMESLSPQEEEFTTPKSSVEEAPSADQSAQTSANVKLTPHKLGSNDRRGLSDVIMSQETPVADTIAAATATTKLAVASRSSGDTRLHPDNSTFDLDRPIASAVAYSLPHKRPQQKPSESQVLLSSTPAPAAISTTPKSIKVEKDLARIREVIEEVSPAALHRVLRQQWRAFLFTPFDEDHVSFILRACFKNATTTIVDRGMKEALSKPEFLPTILNNCLKYSTADQLIKRVPKEVLNEVVAQHLRLAPAKDVVNWLAEGGRLGYSAEDIIDDDDESVSPPDDPLDENTVMSEAPYQPPPQGPHYRDVASTVKDPLLVEQEKNAEIQRQKLIIRHQHQELRIQSRRSHPPPASTPDGNIANELSSRSEGNWDGNDKTCSDCGFTAPTRGGHLYHTTNRVCHRPQPTKGWSGACSNCAQTFTGKQGQIYHELRKVCYSNLHSPANWPIITPEQLDVSRAKVRLLPINRSRFKYTETVQDDDPPVAPARPTFSTGPRVSALQAASTQAQPPTQARTLPGVQIPRPPLHTPIPLPATPQSTQRSQARHNANAATNSAVQALQAIDPEARLSPSQLSAVKKTEMDRQIEAENRKYQNALAAIDPQLPPADQEKRRISLRNGNATKKSQIRKSFGVTLRMRDRDKIASRAVAMASSPAPEATSASGSSRSSPHIPSHVSAPSSGFLPINAPVLRNNPTPPNADGFGRPTPPLPMRTQSGHTDENPSSPQRNVSGIPHSNNTSISGGYQSPSHNVSASQTQSQHRAKRQRTSSFSEQTKPPAASEWIPPLSRTQTPYGPASSSASLSMTEARSEDAASKHPKKVPVGAAQAKWEQLQPKNRANGTDGASGMERDILHANGKQKATEEGVRTTETPMATSVSRVGSNTRAEPIEINSSSDSEAIELVPGGKVPAAGGVNGSGVADADKLFPSTEDTESESGPSRPISSGGVRSGFMAKRGGRRS